ncbi:BspA family leucine-rich repeat surface protein [Ichthyobacterium seriolicida]|nr:BspA family leucine-rich repeat surface protein [Ichthyobacterium seriolicida]
MKFKRISLFLLCAVLSFNSCIKEEIVGVKNEEEGKSGNKILSFELRNVPSNVDVSTDINHADPSISISMNGLISYYDLKSISPSISVSKGAKISYDKLKDFTDTDNPITYTVISESGESRNYKVKFTYELKKFISKWEGSNTIKLPIYKGGDYDFVVDWGDGSKKQKVTSYKELKHRYKDSKEKTITITGKIEGFNFGKVKISQYIETSENHIISIDDWGDLKLLNSIERENPGNNPFLGGKGGVFQGCGKLISLPSTPPDLEKVTDMTNMFKDTYSFNQDLNNWDVSKVTNMTSVFMSAVSFNGNISKWDVKNVTNMSKMFSNARAFNQNIGDWDVSSVTNMESVFEETKVFNQSLNKWKVDNVTNMKSMFSSAIAFNQDLNGWNVGNVTNMSSMFSGNYGITVAFNRDISGWDVSKVTDMSNMFSRASSFNQDLKKWDVSSVTDMHRMFFSSWSEGSIPFNQDISGWDVSKVADCIGFSKNTSNFEDKNKPSFSSCNTELDYSWIKNSDFYWKNKRSNIRGSD